MNDEAPDIAPAVMTMQIIAGALVMGVVMFAFVVAVVLGGLTEKPGQPMISVIGAVLALGIIGMSAVIPRLIERQALSSIGTPESGNLLAIYQTKMIIHFAMLEGVTFFNLVALMIEHHWWSLLIAVVLVSLMALNFPTRTRVEHWLELRRMEAAS